MWCPSLTSRRAVLSGVLLSLAVLSSCDRQDPASTGADEPPAEAPATLSQEATDDTPNRDAPTQSVPNEDAPAEEGPVQERPGDDAEPDGTASLEVPPPEDQRALQAWGLIGAGQFDRARELLGEVLSEYPDAGQAEFFLGVSYQKQKDYVRATEHYERVYEKGVSFERDEVVHYFHGWALYWLGELEGSRRHFELFKAEDPAEADAWFALGLIDYDEDRLEKAEANFRHALSLHEDMARDDPARYRSRLKAVAKCHGRLADVFIRRGELEAARDALQISIETWPNNTQPYYKLYRVLLRLGEDEEAARALRTHQRLLERQGIIEDDG